MARKSKGELQIKPEGFQDAIQELMDEFGAEVDLCLEEAIKQASEEDVRELESAGSFNGGTKYKSGWDYRQTGKGENLKYVVYNADVPGLAHLLEFGHVKKNGGRTREFPHIAPVNDKTGDRVINKLESLL